MSELLPCPFCGGEAERFTIGDDEPNNAGGDVIACIRCQTSSHVEFGRKENLVDRWNTRTPDPRITQLEADKAVLVARLQASMVAIDDWLHVYADELCDAADVAESRKRIGQFGTVGYIAEVQHANREALSRIGGGI